MLYFSFFKFNVVVIVAADGKTEQLPDGVFGLCRRVLSGMVSGVSLLVLGARLGN